MIEVADAVTNCRAIAEIPGIGGLFIGPSGSVQDAIKSG